MTDLHFFNGGGLGGVAHRVMIDGKRYSVWFDVHGMVFDAVMVIIDKRGRRYGRAVNPKSKVWPYIQRAVDRAIARRNAADFDRDLAEQDKAPHTNFGVGV